MGRPLAEAGWEGGGSSKKGKARPPGAVWGAALTRPVEALTGPRGTGSENRPPLPRALSRSRRTSSYAKASEDKETGSVS